MYVCLWIVEMDGDDQQWKIFYYFHLNVLFFSFPFYFALKRVFFCFSSIPSSSFHAFAPRQQLAIYYIIRDTIPWWYARCYCCIRNTVIVHSNGFFIFRLILDSCMLCVYWRVYDVGKEKNKYIYREKRRKQSTWFVWHVCMWLILNSQVSKNIIFFPSLRSF